MLERSYRFNAPIMRPFMFDFTSIASFEVFMRRRRIEVENKIYHILSGRTVPPSAGVEIAK